MGANWEKIKVIVIFHINLDYSFFVKLSIDPIKIDNIFNVSSMNHARKYKIIKKKVEPRFLMINKDWNPFSSKYEFIPWSSILLSNFIISMN